MLPAPISVAFFDDARPSVVLRSSTYAPGRRQVWHRHARTTVTLHFAGGVREWASREDIVSLGLSVSVKPAGVRHADLYGDAGASTFQVTLEHEAALRRWGWGRALGSWRWIRGGPSVRAALSLFRAAHGRPGDTDALREELVALLDALGAADRPTAGHTGPSWLGRALECVNDRHGAGVRVRDAAAAAGVHPVHLARVFRRHVGCTVSEYLRRVRVERAATLLSAARTPISGIAFGCGFADQSHLTREFRRETGLTPAGYRHLAGRADVAFLQDGAGRRR